LACWVTSGGIEGTVVVAVTGGDGDAEGVGKEDGDGDGVDEIIGETDGTIIGASEQEVGVNSAAAIIKIKASRPYFMAEYFKRHLLSLIL
jgi:hypothetical protein